jgi:hypothetical protein
MKNESSIPAVLALIFVILGASALISWPLLAVDHSRSQEPDVRITILDGGRQYGHHQVKEWSYTPEGLLKFITSDGEHRIVRGNFIISFRD